MSKETLEYHWGKHHRAYVENLNKQIVGTKLDAMSLEDVILTTYNKGDMLPPFNNAAQAWNHEFFWESMKPGGGGKPSGDLLRLIERDFGSFEALIQELKSAATTQFGSGWAWLVCELSKWNHTKIFSDFDGDSDGDDMDVETVSGQKSLASSRLKSKVSSLRTKRTARSGKSLPDDLLEQLENEPPDLLDKQKTRSLLRSRGGMKRKMDDNDEIELDPEGRLIIREEGSTQRTTDHDNDDSDFDDNKSVAAKSTVSSKKLQKRMKTSSESTGYAYTGAEYTSKDARGDVKRKGKLEPYAYWPLDRKMVSKRPEYRAAARCGMASVVKLSKNLQGQSASSALHKLSKYFKSCN